MIPELENKIIRNETPSYYIILFCWSQVFVHLHNLYQFIWIKRYEVISLILPLIILKYLCTDRRQSIKKIGPAVIHLLYTMMFGAMQNIFDGRYQSIENLLYYKEFEPS